jgi:hypothetical protein
MQRAIVQLYYEVCFSIDFPDPRSASALTSRIQDAVRKKQFAILFVACCCLVLLFCSFCLIPLLCCLSCGMFEFELHSYPLVLVSAVMSDVRCLCDTCLTKQQGDKKTRTKATTITTTSTSTSISTTATITATTEPKP